MIDRPDPHHFVTTVQPVLAARDLPALLALLRKNWSATQIVSLLSCNVCDARKVAALSLSLVGQPCCLNDLAEQLKDADPMVNQMAEHAMWSIWFRAGPAPANHQLCRGAEAISRGDYPHAISHFDNALQIDPEFSEAYNQRAIAKYLLEQYDSAMEDCRQCIKRMPIHFGALAGLGHCHAHLNELEEATKYYRRALAINPHMNQIREAVAQMG